MVDMDGTVISTGRLRRAAIIGALALATTLGVGASPVAAHDDIKSSTPPSRSTLQEPISTVEIAAVNGTASAAELELALERIKDLDAELSAAESKVSALQSLLEAEWPGPPRAAPR